MTTTPLNIAVFMMAQLHLMSAYIQVVQQLQLPITTAITRFRIIIFIILLIRQKMKEFLPLPAEISLQGLITELNCRPEILYGQ
ncbi:hypothetical protein DSECCO2_589680 [anaerobic digester metagenome]